MGESESPGRTEQSKRVQVSSIPTTHNGCRRPPPTLKFAVVMTTSKLTRKKFEVVQRDSEREMCVGFRFAPLCLLVTCDERGRELQSEFEKVSGIQAKVILE